MTNRKRLIDKLKDKSRFLTKAESDELGPVTARDLAPITGDSFVDGILETGTLPTGTLNVDPNAEPTDEQIALARVKFRDRWYGNVTQELNRKAAEMLAAGKITQAQHDEIVAENRRKDRERNGRMYE